MGGRGVLGVLVGGPGGGFYGTEALVVWGEALQEHGPFVRGAGGGGTCWGGGGGGAFMGLFRGG